MQIYKISGKGDELLLETDVVAEAEKILKSYAKKGCFFAVNLPTEEVETSLVKEVEKVFEREDVETIHILYPMAGGNG